MEKEGGVEALSIRIKDVLKLGLVTFWTFAFLYAGLFKSVETFLKVTITLNVFRAAFFILMPISAIEMYGLAETYDGVHVWLVYRIAILMFSWAASTFVCLGSDDVTVSSSLLWSQLVTNVLFCLNSVHNMWNSGFAADGWTTRDLHLASIFAMHLVWMASCVAQLGRFDSFGGYTEHANRLNLHIRLDSLLTLFVGLMYLAYPDFLFKIVVKGPKIEELHLHLARVEGILYFTSALFIASSTKFLFDMIKVRLLLCRFVTNIAAVIVSALLFRTYDMANHSGFAKLSPISIAFVLNPLLGFLFSRYGQLK